MDLHWLAEEHTAISAGYSCIAGIDEAGRGALAGPVVAACVVLPPNFVPDGVNDSKQLSKKDRDVCFQVIISSAAVYGIGIVQADVIDRINILQATHLAMRNALANLPKSVQPDIALIDGLPVRPFPITQRAIVRGDAASASIASASIIAKVTRDRLMCELHERYPQYLFSKHKGYGTRAHFGALDEYGPTTEHRRTFRPVADLLAEFAAPTVQQTIAFAQDSHRFSGD